MRPRKITNEIQSKWILKFCSCILSIIKSEHKSTRSRSERHTWEGLAIRVNLLLEVGLGKGNNIAVVSNKRREEDEG